METIESKKTTGQLSFRVSPEVKEALEKAAGEKAMTIAEYLRSLAEGSIATPAIQEPTESKVEEKSEGLKQLLAKADEILAALQKSEQTMSQEDVEKAILDGVNAGLAEAIAETEETLRQNHLLLRFDENQRSVLVNLLSFRKEKGEDDSLGSIERFIVSAIKHKVLDSVFFPTIPSGFKDEFKNAFGKELETTIVAETQTN